MEKYLPLSEILRPKRLDEVLGNKTIIKNLKSFVKDKNIPNLLFYGSPSVGKTTVAFALCRELYGDNFNSMVLELNASDNRNIQVVRDIIKEFVCTKSFFSNDPKFIILDEADSMTSDAQFCMRRIIEKYNNNARFCFICNNLYKIIPAITSRCTPLQFLKPSFQEISNLFIKNNLKPISYEIYSKNDLRKLLNNYQFYQKLNLANEIEIIDKIKEHKNDMKGYLRELFFLRGYNIVYLNKLICDYYLEKGGNFEDIIIETAKIENIAQSLNSEEVIEIYNNLFNFLDK